MNYGKLFAFVLVALQLAACVAYAVQRDWRHASYWFFAAGITLAVTI
jgi:hypothetical protein